MLTVLAEEMELIHCVLRGGWGRLSQRNLMTFNIGYIFLKRMMPNKGITENAV